MARCSKKCCAIASLIAISVTLLISSIVGIISVSAVTQDLRNQRESSDKYSIGDTRIIDPSEYLNLGLCVGIAMTVHSLESTVNATLYSLSTPPKLDTKDDVNHTVKFHGDDRYAYFYLYRGSNVTISACTALRIAEYNVLVFKGRNNYDLWKNGHEGSPVFYKLKVTALCDSVIPSPIRTISIPEADEWYFATDKSAPDGSTVWLFLQRYEYTVKSSSVISSCNAGGLNHPESCTVVKSPDTTYLLKIGSGPSESIVVASIGCDVDDASVAAIILALVIVAILASFGLVLVIRNSQTCRQRLQNLKGIVACYQCFGYHHCDTMA